MDRAFLVCRTMKGTLGPTFLCLGQDVTVAFCLLATFARAWEIHRLATLDIDAPSGCPEGQRRIAAKRRQHVAHGVSRGLSASYRPESREAATAMFAPLTPLRGLPFAISSCSAGSRPQLRATVASRLRRLAFQSGIRCHHEHQKQTSGDGSYNRTRIF